MERDPSDQPVPRLPDPAPFSQVVITPGRHPFEVGVFAAVALVGFVGLIEPDGRSRAVIEFVPDWFVASYYGVALLWAVVGLIGLSLRDVELRLQVERVACYGVGYTALTYCIAGFAYSGIGAFTAAVGIGWISPAATWRICQIHLDLARLREHRQEVQVRPDPAGGDEGEGR